MELQALPRADPSSAKIPRGTPARSKRTRWRVLAWVVVHLLVLVHVAHWKLAGTTLTPVEPSEAGETLTLGYVNAGFLLFVGLILVTLVVGRFFCGWACHVVAYQDAAAFLLAKLGLRPKPIRSRLLVLVPIFAALEMFAFPALARALDGHGFPDLALHLTTYDLWMRFPGPVVAGLTFVVDGFLLVWLLGAKGFCTYGCPYGAVFGLVDRGAKGRIRVTDACEGCGHCTAVCTSNVRVHEEVARFGNVVDPGCMKCLDCVSVCPKDALYFGFSSANAGREAKRGRPRRTYDFTWPEEIVMALVFVGALWAWRGLYDLVPFLLALGLAVLASAAAVTLWRLVRQREFTFQHHALRRNGSFTGAGALAGLLALAMLALTAHGGAVRTLDARAETALEAAEASGPGAERDAHVDAASSDLDWVSRWSLVGTADVANKLGSIHYSRGDLDAAEREMRRAVELDPTFTASRLVLADIQARRGEMEAALDELEALVAVDPVNVDAGRRLEGLVTRDPSNARARALLDGIILAIENAAAE